MDKEMEHIQGNKTVVAVAAAAVTGAVYEFKALHDDVMMPLNEPGC